MITNNLINPVNLKEWVNNNRHLLKPPVANKVVWENGDFIVMVVGGPNSRKDFHYNETPEFFYQVEGDIILKIINNDKQEDVKIKEGEIYLLPPKVYHSPQRFENTIGLVIESKRPQEAKDSLAWFCEKCNNKLFEKEFKLKNIEIDLPIIFNDFYSNKKLTTCKNCGHKMEAPKKL